MSEPRPVIAVSGAMTGLLGTLRKAAKAPFPVVLTGPTGVGKTFLTRYLHHQSGRRDGPYLTVDCSRLRGPLLEADLLGVRKGAATGVDESPGRFVEADGGVLVLENLDLLSPEDQPVLLRVLETGQVQPVGGGEEVQVDVRILVTAQTPLEDLVAQGQLREDLYYRLSVLHLQVPTLAQREADRVPLFEQMAGTSLDDAAAARVAAYSWPGNLWQMKNAAELAVLKAGSGRIGLHHLPDLPEVEPGSPEAPPPFTVPRPYTPRALAEVEREHILKTLDHVHGNRTRAAKILGISRKSLWERLKRWREEEP